MIRAEIVLGLVALVVFLVALFEAITTPAARVRNLPKPAWIGIILVLDVVGAVLWFLAGRPRRTPRPGGPTAGTRGRPARGPAPDDDPDFLRGLDTARREQRDRLGPWEAERARREAERRREGGPEPV